MKSSYCKIHVLDSVFEGIILFYTLSIYFCLEETIYDSFILSKLTLNTVFLLFKTNRQEVNGYNV